MRNLSNIMDYLYEYKIGPRSFCVFFLLFAILPIAEEDSVTSSILYILAGIAVFISFLSGMLLLRKNRKKFILDMLATDSSYLIANTIISIIGMAVSYYYKPDLFNLWIFFLLLEVLSIFIPNTKLED